MYKRKASRSIRLSIDHDGSVRVSMPFFVPYQAGIRFVHTKSKWLLAQRQHAQQELKTGDRIGKAHQLVFVASSTSQKITSRVSDSSLIITHPKSQNFSAAAIQAAARLASLKALRVQAKALLPGRLRKLSQQTGLSYHSVRCRQLKSRWGSCSSNGDITLNIYLMQLPWGLIDYVLIHELTHTKVMHHGPDFWSELERHLPNAKSLRKSIRAYRSAISV